MGDQGATNRNNPRAQAAGAQAQGAPASNTPSLDPRDLAERVIVALSPVQIYGLSALADARGVVTLVGAARTEREYERAEKIAASVPGVTRVLNHLVVDTLAGSTQVDRSIADPELAAEIELNHLNMISGTEVNFNRDAGTTDTAESAAEDVPFFAPTDPPVLRAPRAAQGFQMAGGFSETSMDAPIDLEQLPRQLMSSDDEIARLVRMALSEDAGTTDLPIAVHVRRGVVYLRGVVQSLAEVEFAEGVASRVPGVEEVREELEVVGM